MRFKHSILRLAFIISLLFSAVAAFGQTCSIITTPTTTTYCVGMSYSFRLSCSPHQRETTWTVDGSDAGTDASLDYTFSTTGTHTVRATGKFATPFEGDWNYMDYEITVSVVSSLPAPQISASKSTVCDSESVTLTITNVDSRLTYVWTSDPAGFTATGSQVSFNNISNVVKFIVSPSGVGCAMGADITIQGRSTTISPVLDPQIPYHKRYLGGSASGNGHYWQNSVNGTSTSLPVQGTMTLTQEGDYWIRRFDSFANCWTIPSAQVHVALNFAPPLAEVSEVKQIGYSDFFYRAADKDHILQFADYYWVNDNSANPTIKSPFIEAQVVRSARIETEGVYYLKGRDRATGTWGPTLTITVTMRSDDEFNWIHTKVFDGTNQANAFSEGRLSSDSKDYFDLTGTLIQTQSPSLQSRSTTKPYIMIGQTLRDQYDRVVGSPLPMPRFATSFKYINALMKSQDNAVYDYSKFDLGKILNPEPVASDAYNTVGWYYSQNNDKETHVPVTQYPYSRVEYYDDGTDEVKRSASPGDEHRMGKGHEKLMGSFPVVQELADYWSKRPIAMPGVVQQVSSFKDNGTQVVTLDENTFLTPIGKRINVYSISVSDKSGKTVMTAKSRDSTDYELAVTNSITASGDRLSQNYRPLTYFYLLEESIVTLSGSGFVVEDIVNDVVKLPGEKFTQHNGKWPPGFYRIVLSNSTDLFTLSYTNYYQDVAYYFYDGTGKMKVSVSPNGVHDWLRNTPYANIDKTTYAYSFQGRLISLQQFDAGKTEYLYRKDGNIRFSQTELQRTNDSGVPNSKGKFSYTNYDDLGRALESGEYIGNNYSYAGLSAYLEKDGQDQMTLASGDKRDWVLTTYDVPQEMELNSSNMGLPAEYQRQTFLQGAVSKTQNANSQTWYSYDEAGNLVWMVQKPNTLNMTFVVKYEYDFSGNVQKVSNLAFRKNQQTPAAQFYHQYEYDADKRLSKVSTSIAEGGEQKLRASYIYYLHGPLKRIILGDSLQGVDFVYNINGWLTQINHPDRDKDPGGDANDAFGMIINYYETEVTAPALSSLDSRDGVRRFHKLPIEEETSPSRISYLVDFYRQNGLVPVSPWKKYSAEQPEYKQKVEQLMKSKEVMAETVENTKG